MKAVSKREAARRDLVELFVYLAETAGLDMADRLLANAESRFADLARQPMMGRPLTLTRPELANIRKWRVKDFDTWSSTSRAMTACPSCACCTRPVIGRACWDLRTNSRRTARGCRSPRSLVPDLASRRTCAPECCAGWLSVQPSRLEPLR